MPQDAKPQGGRPVPPNRAYPRVWTLFESLGEVYGAAENVAHSLEKIEGKQAELEKRFDRSQYAEPPEFSESRLAPEQVTEANERRALLAGGQDLSGIEHLLSEDVERLTKLAKLAKRVHVIGTERWKGWALLDDYACLRHALRQAIARARAATSAAAPDIDPQGAGLERPSTKILTALADLGGSLPDPQDAHLMRHVCEPGLYHGRVVSALPSIWKCIGMVRPDAHREATSTLPSVPPVQPTAQAVIEDRRVLNAAEHTVMLSVGRFLAEHPAERAAAAARLEAQINPDAVRRQFRAEQVAAAERCEAKAQKARAQGNVAWAEEQESRARTHRSNGMDPEHGWIQTAGKLGALAESFATDGAPPTEMPYDKAFDALFLVWCLWTATEDFVALGCPSLAGPNGEEARSLAMDDLRDYGGAPNAFGLRRPFEVARRALAELEAQGGGIDRAAPSQPVSGDVPSGGGRAADADDIQRIAELAAEKALQTAGVGKVAPPKPSKLPTLKPWAMEAWTALQCGETVTAIAATLAKKYKDKSITQPRVSEQIGRAKLHSEASGLAAIAAKTLGTPSSRAPARTFDPSSAEMGARTDGKAHHIRERERQKAQDDDPDGE